MPLLRGGNRRKSDCMSLLWTRLDKNNPAGPERTTRFPGTSTNSWANKKNCIYCCSCFAYFVRHNTYYLDMGFIPVTIKAQPNCWAFAQNSLSLCYPMNKTNIDIIKRFVFLKGYKIIISWLSLLNGYNKAAPVTTWLPTLGRAGALFIGEVDFLGARTSNTPRRQPLR